MPRMENNGGDRLARGAASFTFKPAGAKLSREQWDEIFSDEQPEPVVKGTYLFKCPTHGTQSSTREAYLSGGYPLVDEYVKSICTQCDEVTTYAGFQAYAKQCGGDTDTETGVTCAYVGEAVPE